MQPTDNPRFSRTVKVTLDAYLQIRQSASTLNTTVTDLVSGCMGALIVRLPLIWAAAESRNQCPYQFISEALDSALERDES